ncbi:hypothetical protein Bhyg_14254 [Pseudolycoriella hygida]|uniref:Uncharacterized protein n=1 Tax=Pseudolycoriella hygida TaxID=35572 RepID=A0A9Q0RX96_9DIPT|nr:hypothetical protein Bhyg_14254 [Pseudolycoriella hygida]
MVKVLHIKTKTMKGGYGTKDSFSMYSRAYSIRFLEDITFSMKMIKFAFCNNSKEY